MTWDNGVLDFYKDKLMQVGFSRTTATPDMSAFEGGTQPPYRPLRRTC